MALNRGRLARSGRLPCGHTIDSLWERVRSGASAVPDEHVARCRHCQTALEGLRALHAATEELAAEEVSAPPGLFDRVMRVVRTEARRGDTVPLVTGPDPASVSTTAVAAVVRFAVDTLPGQRLRARRCRVQAPPGTVDVLDVSVEVLSPSAAEWDETELRRRIAAVVSAHVGVRVRRLELDVVPLEPGEEAR
ncbi:hypothetical protein LX15_001747 [Streptoalloteichus tenebrarius]|uniref:Asp23/Gls24 family envelope stress response protein n=1 Tax=Streptoalloteichus tenebrarius (strain ATCC 17920 / DSM 40477 / JCM 4838 / CBS 697.72 / NBRC 16177 / NCIMB 11028 / NRRL B-12390 / A12253. 1 / ISP 5477) TaxID=1933 RepID=A0ABT1HRB1_STRSD|nr:Asp23/Gls24 family envelope stress response protein [Streptoalloteichus tenebrarius]MCP2258060.1 hypothetical protein [Streptoalloteichus tenebrarius]BFF01731.1 hypothetical protein GCM10020241_34060 [Streptoalloteichus tenebrarius]